MPPANRPPARRPPVAAIVACLLLPAVPAPATTMLAADTPDLVRLADAVAVADVVEVRSERTGGTVVTRVELRVSRSVKGLREGETVEVLVPGGEADGWVQKVQGAPEPHAGEAAVVFLERTGGRGWRFLLLEQGHLRVDADASVPGGWAVLRARSARLVRPGPGGALEPAPALPAKEPLEPYLRRLDALAREGSRP